MPKYERAQSLLHSFLQWISFFLCGMWKYMRSDWKANKQNNVRWGCLHHRLLPHDLFFLPKMSFVHEQVWDMQTSTLSRNKYTRSQKKVAAFDKRDTDSLIEDIQKHSTVWWSQFVTSNTYIQTLLAKVTFSSFQSEIRIAADWQKSSLGCIFSLPRHNRGECWSLLAVKDSSTKRISSFDTA